MEVYLVIDPEGEGVEAVKGVFKTGAAAAAYAEQLEIDEDAYFDVEGFTVESP